MSTEMYRSPRRPEGRAIVNERQNRVTIAVPIFGITFPDERVCLTEEFPEIVGVPASSS